ncbi:MAG: hypothetical protein Q4D10_03455 [Bacteroidales bacterium]|nr:hypothetical protein [Bacteroidales bacterium]
MSEVKGQTTIHYVKQGDSLTCSLRSTFPLKQFVTNGAGTVSPAFATNKPCIYPVVRSSLHASRVAPQTSGMKWYYNGVEIQFSSGLSQSMGGVAAGTFKSEVKTIDGFAVPTLTILKDLASSSNIDSDTIEFRGTVNTGFAAVVSASIEVSIEQTDGEAYLAYISINNGGVIDDGTSSLTAKAHLLVGGTEKSSGVSYAWYKMNVSAGVDGWVSLNKTTQSITIAASDVNSSELYKCVVTSGGKTASAVMEVVDETDILVLYPNPTNQAGNPVPEELSSAQPLIVYRPKVYKRSTQQQDNSFTRFNFLLTNSAGDEIASQDNAQTFSVLLDHAQEADGDLTLIISA